MNRSPEATAFGLFAVGGSVFALVVGGGPLLDIRAAEDAGLSLLLFG